MLPSATFRSFFALGALLALSGTAAAQSVNVDVGIAFGTPANGYGAAAGQAGFWNEVDAGSIGVVFNLNGLGGATSPVTASYQVFGNTSGNFSFDDPGTTGDDGKLLDDFQDVGSGTSLAIWTFDGLTAGSYEVYTYSWAADDPVGSTSTVRVQGSPDPAQTLGGLWPGTHLQGVTYAKHSLLVGVSGQIVVEVQATSGFGSVNGFQLVQSGGGGPTIYCTAQASSLPGCTPTIGAPTATASLSGGSGSYDITCGPVPGGPNPAIVFYSTAGPLANPIASPFGFLCVTPGGKFFRVGPATLPGGSTGQCNGNYTFDFGNYLATQTIDPNLLPGAQVDLQAWYRDPGAAAGANYSNALAFSLIP